MIAAWWRRDGDQASVHGDQRLARADVALEQQVHRLRPGHASIDVGDRAPLRIRRLERQRRVERIEQRRARSVRDPGALGRESSAPEPDPELQREQLVELQPLARGLELALIVREVDPPQRSITVGERLGREHVLRDRIRERRELLERSPYELADGAGTDAFGGAVHRRDATRVHEVLLVASQDLDLLVRELQSVPVQLHRARHRDLHALAVQAGSPGLVEEREVEEPGAVADRDRDHRLAPAGLPLLHRADRRDHGRERVDLQVADRQHERAVDVAARVVVQQLADGLDAERVGEHDMGLGAFRPAHTPGRELPVDGLDRVDGRQWHGGPSTFPGSTMPA
jgi:hypothetical protein